MSANDEALPGLLAEVADLIGRDAALLIANARGGTSVYLPAKPTSKHWLSQLIGHELACKLCDDIACGIGIRLDIPLGPAGRLKQLRDSIATMMNDMLREGRSEREIVLATGFTARTVRNRKREMRSSLQVSSTIAGTSDDCRKEQA